MDKRLPLVQIWLEHSEAREGVENVEGIHNDKTEAHNVLYFNRLALCFCPYAVCAKHGHDDSRAVPIVQPK